MPQTGMLVQIGGSFHRWLGDDGPQFTLLLAVDDATSAVANAVFCPEEDTCSYFTLMQGLVERWDVPIALYGDRHGVFKFSGKPRHIQPPVEATHFSRAMEELGIQQIFARSSQAKGRVECATFSRVGLGRQARRIRFTRNSMASHQKMVFARCKGRFLQFNYHFELQLTELRFQVIPCASFCNFSYSATIFLNSSTSSSSLANRAFSNSSSVSLRMGNASSAANSSKSTRAS